MKIVVLTYGTEGDTRPLIALSHALIQAGHETILLGEARSLGSARRLAVPVRPLSGDIRTLFTRWSQSGARGTAKALVELTNTQSAAWMAQTLETAQGCDAILVSGLAGFVGLSVAERLAIPAIGAGMIPLTPSNEFPSPFLAPAWSPPGSTGPACGSRTNSSGSACAKPQSRQGRRARPAAQGQALDHPPHALRHLAHPPAAAPGLARQRHPLRPMDPAAGQRLHTPGRTDTVSRSGPPAHLRGLWQHDRHRPAEHAPDRHPSPGRPPRRRLARMERHGHDDTAAQHPADRRHPPRLAIPQNGRHHPSRRLRHLAHRRKCRPAIHHPALRRRPGLLADRLHRLGVAAPAVSPQRLHAKALAQAIAFVEQPAVNARAAQLGQAMARENGLAVAVERMEKWLATRAAR